jgi:phosphocarrier protein
MYGYVEGTVRLASAAIGGGWTKYMTELSQTRTVVLMNTAGLHLRAANLFVQLAVTFESKIEVIKDNQRVDGKSIMNLLMLGAVSGSEMQIVATGSDAEKALSALTELVAKKFYEDDQEQP